MRNGLLLVMIIIVCSFCPAPTHETDASVMVAADSRMDFYLSKIEPGNEEKYGFTGDDDLDACVVGKPYRIIEFNRSFYDDSLQENEEYLAIKNKWLVPLSINHQYRSFLSVSGNTGNLNVSGITEAAQAKEIQLTSAIAGDSDELYLLKVPQLNADFFVDETNNSFAEARFIPLETAITAIPALESKKDSYTLIEVEKIVKHALAGKTH